MNNIDKQIAIEVMGWHLDQAGHYWCVGGMQPLIYDKYTFTPSTNLVQAMDIVVERLRELGLTIIISSPPPGMKTWDVRGWDSETNDNRFIAHDKTLLLAICEGALKAVRGSDE